MYAALVFLLKTQSGRTPACCSSVEQHAGIFVEPIAARDSRGTESRTTFER